MNKLRLRKPTTIITFKNNIEVIKKNVESINLPSAEEVFLVLMESYSDHYTGGRYHIFEYIVSLCKLNFIVVLVTNCKPLYIESFKKSNLNNLKILLMPSGNPSPSIFIEDNYVFKNIIGTPLGCFSCVREYKKRHLQKVKAYYIVLVVPELASQYRIGVDVDITANWYEAQKRILSDADGILTQTELQKQWLKKTVNIAENKIYVIPPYINEFEANQFINLKQKNQILYLGRFVTYKHPEIAYQVIKDLKWKGKFIMIGGAGGLGYQKFKQLAIQDNIDLEIIPICSDEKKFKIIAESRLLLFPSDWEDFGMPPMEAGYYGINSVVFNNPTYSEVFRNFLYTAKRNNYQDYLIKAKQALKDSLKNLDLQWFIQHNYLEKNMLNRLKCRFLSVGMPNFILYKSDFKNKEVTILWDTKTNVVNRGIGDILMMTPTIRTLKKMFPNSKIDFYIDSYAKDILQYNPYIDKIITEQKDLKENYTFRLQIERKLEDYSIIRNRQHRVDSISELFSIPSKDKSLVLNLTTVEIKKGKEYLLDNKNKNIGICVTSSSPWRNWDLLKFKILIKYLIINKYNIYLLDKEFKNYFNLLKIINLTGKLNIRQLCGLIKNLDLLVTIDTGLLHIAGALKTKTLLLNGMIPSEQRAKYYSNCFVIEHLNCKDYCYDLTFGKARTNCRKLYKCFNMQLISAEEVCIKINNILGKKD